MIGVFDSGSGGLTVVRALQKLAPQVDILFRADTANMPYGDKSDEEIKRLTIESIAFLRSQGASTIVSACNSVSASVLRPMMELLDVRDANVIEMVGPAVEDLARRGIMHIALLATPATVRSGMYASIARQHGIEVISIVCPDLATLIETDADDEKIANAVRSALLQIPQTTRYVLLGCTHYPLVIDVFEQIASEEKRPLQFIDPANAVAAETLLRHGAVGAGVFRLVITQPSYASAHLIQATPALLSDCRSHTV